MTKYPLYPTLSGLALSTLLILTACKAGETPQGKACTLIGCVDGLTVKLTGKTASQFSLEVVPADGQKWTIQCPTGGSNAICFPANEVLIQKFTPAEVTITATVDGKNTTKTFKPTYTQVNPNGPDCPNQCKQGHVTLELAP